MKLTNDYYADLCIFKDAIDTLVERCAWGFVSENELYLKMYDLYYASSVICADATGAVIVEYSNNYDWDKIEIIARAMNRININEKAMP